MPHKIVGVGPALDPVPLLPGEQVIFSVHPNIVPMIALSLLVIVTGVGISLLFMVTNITVFFGFPQYATIVNLAPVMISVLVVFTIFLNWLNTLYTLTDRRVQWEFGILGERIRSIDNTDIQAVQVDQGLSGRILNYGDIFIRSAQQPIPIDFLQIASPGARSEQIISQQP